MSKKETISKIMDRYSKYGLSRIEVEISYFMAILWRVPKESIYPGLKMIFNNVFGIQDDAPAIETGAALFDSAIRETRNENPCASDKDIADSIETIGIDSIEDSLEDIDFSLLGKVKETMLNATKEFLKNNR